MQAHRSHCSSGSRGTPNVTYALNAPEFFFREAHHNWIDPFFIVWLLRSPATREPTLFEQPLMDFAVARYTHPLNIEWLTIVSVVTIYCGFTTTA